MANYSDIFPLASGGGAANIAGFAWEEKTTEFTAVANKAYYVDTALGNVLMTLPSSPSNGDEVAFLIIGANALNITSTDKFRGSFLNTSLAKQISENYVLFIFSYVDATTGWDWQSRYNSFITTVYIGEGVDVVYVNTPANNEIPLMRNANNSDIFYRLGTTNLFPTDTPSSFINPHTRGAITATASSENGSASASRAFDNDLFNSNWQAGVVGTAWLKIVFNNGITVSPTRYALNNSYWVNSLTSFTLEGSSDGTNWIEIHSGLGINTNSASRDWYTSPAISSSFYSQLRIVARNPSFLPVIMEMCLWGIVLQT